METPKQTAGIIDLPDDEKESAAGLPATPRETNNQEQSSPIKYAWQVSPDLWPECVDGQALLNEMHGVFNRYLVLPEHATASLALWTLHTYSFHLGNISAYLALLSPEKRCGKTTALTVLSEIAHRALPASNISGAAVFRVIEKYAPTLMIDESDSFVRDNEELRGILNAGNCRGTAFVIRCVGEGSRLEEKVFGCFGPKLFAGIGKLPGTLEDRSIIIRMRRKLGSEGVERLRRLDGSDLRQKCMRWTDDHQDKIEEADPPIPDELNDRAADIWRPLITIADLAGGEWPGIARKAASGLSEEKDDDSLNVKLLSDIREYFEARELGRVFTRDLLAYLISLDERPWRTFNRGFEISARQLSDRLRGFGIRSRDVRIETDHAKGYLLADCEEAFNRYLPPQQA